MKDLQKEKLDRIGRKMLETAMISDEEIEQIVAAPQLFDAVKARIKTEQRERKTESFSGGWSSPIFWNWQRISVVSAAFALFVFGAVSFVLINKAIQINEQAAFVPAIETPVEKIEIPEIPQDFIKFSEKDNPEPKPQLIAEKASFKKETFRKPKTGSKKPAVKRQNPPKTELASEFYALNYVGTPNGTGENLRVVRTELSSSALFALGVDVPIENAKDKFKTDLLVGSDGVARAIRFVK